MKKTSCASHFFVLRLKHVKFEYDLLLTFCQTAFLPSLLSLLSICVLSFGSTFANAHGAIDSVSMQSFPSATGLNMSSKHLIDFHNVAANTSPIPFDGEHVCHLSHESMKVDRSKDLLRQIARLDSLNEDNLFLFEDSRNVFRNHEEVFDNIYCFPLLGNEMRRHEGRISLMEGYDNLKNKMGGDFSLIIYYEDGFDGAEARLYAYIVDFKTNDVYKLKAVHKL